MFGFRFLGSSSRRASLVPIVLTAVTLSMTAPLSAQLAGKGAISGNIQDTTGAAIPNARIIITNQATGVSTKTTSTGAGDYNVPTLDPGKYNVQVEAEGFQKQNQQNVQVNALEIVTYSPKLTIGASTETITVSTAPPQLQTENATLGATLEADMYSALPIEMGAYGSPDQRRATDFAQLLPGVQGNETNGNATTNTGVINGVGARGAASAVYVDGVPFTNAAGEGDPRFVWSAISVDAVDQFQVQTSGISAIYEGNGVLNFNIKQGGNKYHGAVYEFFRNTALDTFGFYKTTDPLTGLPRKPVEHQNEYGINLSGPLLPFGSLRDKVFYFGNYNGFRYSANKPGVITFPNAAERAGNFQGVAGAASTANLTNPFGPGIYDPNTQAACTANSTTGQCRYRFGYIAGAGKGKGGNPVINPATGAAGVDVIPSAELSKIALALQAGVPQTTAALQQNYTATNYTGLNNFSTTHRIDIVLSSKDNLSLTGAYGRQGSSVPVGQNTNGRNTGPLPYNYGQAYAPKTTVAIIEETHQFTSRLINQFKYGFARYDAPGINADYTPAYALASYGYTGAPAGQANGSFPIVTFSGVNAPTNYAGMTGNVGRSNSYELLDNVQWTLGKHTLTLGAMVSWLQYNYNTAVGGSTPVTLANSVSETAAFNTTNGTSLISGTGVAYASFLLGQADSVSFTQNTVPTTYGRFRPISPYVEDVWKVTPKLTLDLGLRYDFYPAYTEAHNVLSFFNPNKINPATGVGGALDFAGSGTNTCNCSTPVNNYFKNIGPRIGLAYQIDPKTVVRASYNVSYTHGNGVGGSAISRTGTGTLGFSASPKFSANTTTFLSTAPLDGGLPGFTSAAGRSSSPSYGTGYTTTAGYTGTPSSISYGDPYLGGRAPQFENYTFGFEHQWTTNFTTSLSYVGSEGHFLQADGSNARGFYADQLDPRYLVLGDCLTAKVSALASTIVGGQPCSTRLAATGATIPKYFSTSQSLSAALLPFPMYSVGDAYGQVSNAHYNALQATANMRLAHGVTFMMNYTWSRSIDDSGTFRSGYAIPAAYSNTGRSYAPDEIERSVSAANQPHHFVFTGVEKLPFGTGRLGGSNRITRAIFGGFQFSQIAQIYSGSPLAIVASSKQTNPAESGNVANLNPAFTGNPRTTKHWSGLGPNIVASTDCTSGPFVAPTSTCLGPLSYTFGNSPRTAPYGLTGPGNFTIDISLRRAFPLHFTEAARLSVQADLYNVTNFVQFGGINVTVGNNAFGTPTTQANNPRQAQLSARIEF